MAEIDTRPANCRHRLQDEGKAYPRSSCSHCGKTITTGLGRACTLGVVGGVPLKTAPASRPLLELEGALRLIARVHLRADDQLGFYIVHGATPEMWVDHDAYARAWETVFNALGGVIE